MKRETGDGRQEGGTVLPEMNTEPCWREDLWHTGRG